MSFPVEASFNQVLEDCITGKLLKEQALELLDNKYKSAYVDIKQKFGKDRQSFCCYVPCDFEEWIKICDGAERNKSFSGKKHNNNKIQKVIDEYTAVCGKNELESESCIVEVYKEVYEIQNLCRENQETKELYEKYRDEIEVLPEAIQQQSIDVQDRAEKIKKETERTITILLKAGLIIKIKTTDGDIEYRKADTVGNIKEFLKLKKENGTIIIPEINEIDAFMEEYLRNETGSSLYHAIRMNTKRHGK